MREQRPDDDLGALGERLLRRLLRAAGGAAVVLHQKLDVGAVEFGQRHLGGVLHRLRHGAGVAAGRQRQDQADLDGAGADRGGLLRRRAAPLLIEQIRQVPEHAVSSQQTRRPAARRRGADERRQDRAQGVQGRTHAGLLKSGLTRRCQVDNDFRAYCRRLVNQMERIMNPLPPGGPIDDAVKPRRYNGGHAERSRQKLRPGRAADRAAVARRRPAPGRHPDREPARHQPPGAGNAGRRRPDRLRGHAGDAQAARPLRHRDPADALP